MGFPQCDRSELQLNGANLALSGGSQTQGFYLPKYKPLRAAHTLAEVVARAGGASGDRGWSEWVLVTRVRSTCKFTKLHVTMPAIFYVYVMLPKE